MSEVRFKVNGVNVSVDVDEDTPLLWVLRENLQLTGTRFGCGVGQCGACTVHFNGAATRTCVLPVAACAGADVRTIEALGPHALQEAWIAEQVPQCGYCQSGQLMVAAKLLEANPTPSDADINAAMTNFCRCATYDRMRKAIKRAAKAMAPLPAPEPPQVPEEISE